MDLVLLALTQAAAVDAGREKSFYRAVLAAVSSLFTKKGSERFMEAMGKLDEEVKRGQLAARGVFTEKKSAAAAAVLKAFGRLGVKPAGKKKAKGKR